MPILSVYPSYPLFFDKNGNPLENGSIYVGTAGSNAVNNQIQAYFDDAKTIAASQPIRTKAGYPINPSTGDRVMIYVDVTDYSLVVKDRNGVTIIEENNMTDLTYKSASASDDNATDIATNTADIATNTADIATNTSNISTNTTKLAGIEAGADVTDATNVNAAGATMNTDTSLAGNAYFLDEDTMSSNDATKVPSQQSVKAYVDTQVSSSSDFACFAADDLTGPASSVWESNPVGTRIDVTDGAYSASTFNFTFNAGIYETTTGHYTTIRGSIKKEASGNPFVFMCAAVDQWSGVYTGETQYKSGNTATSGSSVDLDFVNPNISNVFGLVKIEREDISNELCFKLVHQRGSGTITDVRLYLEISGAKNYTGTPISSSNGTTF